MVDRALCFDVPAEWSLEQAATVPVVYATAYYALVVRGRMKRGNRVLIHSGSGGNESHFGRTFRAELNDLGVGQAAIAIALYHGCSVFTTVSTAEKQAFLQVGMARFSNARKISVLISH